MLCKWVLLMGWCCAGFFTGEDTGQRFDQHLEMKLQTPFSPYTLYKPYPLLMYQARQVGCCGLYAHAWCAKFTCTACRPRWWPV